MAAITQYICGALNASEDRTREYLQALTAAIVEISDADRDLAAALVIVDAVSDIGRSWPNRVRFARRRMLKHGWAPEGATPNLGRASGFRALLCPDADADRFWAEVVSCYTTQEEVRAFKRQMETGDSGTEYHNLRQRSEWKRLESALEGSARARQEIHFVAADALRCPCSYTALPTSVRIELRSAAIASTVCGHVLLSEDF